MAAIESRSGLRSMATAALEPMSRQRQRGVGARNRRGPRSAVGLQDVTVHPERALAERRSVDHRPQATPDQALNLEGAAGLLPLGCFPIHPPIGRAGQEGILCRHPSLTRALEKARHAFLATDRAHHLGGAELAEH